MTPSPPPWQPQAQFPTNSLKLITPIIYISSHSELLSAPQTFLQDLNIQSSLPETPSLAPSLDIISYWPWILALLWQGVCSLNQQIFIKYLQKVTLTNMWPWASYITSLSLNFLIRKKKVTITTFKSYIENYMRQSSFQTLYISLLQTVILYPSPPSPLPIMKAFSQIGLKPLVTHCVCFSFIALKALCGPYFLIVFPVINATVSSAYNVVNVWMNIGYFCNWRDWGQEEKGTTEDELAGWHHWLDGRLSKLRELVMDREAWHAAVHGVAKSWTRLSDWTELNKVSVIPTTRAGIMFSISLHP